MSKKIKVLIVDDSAVVRRTLQEVLEADPHIEVSATASDPYAAAQKMRREAPDVITLDIEMPRMDGLTFLQKLMQQYPVPVVICSSVAGRGSENAIRALEYGALDIVEKPKIGTQQFLTESRIRICDVVKAASKANLKPLSSRPSVEGKLTADAIISKGSGKRAIQTTE
ncbi:MAG: response regulator, partial [Desulfobacteraceae bacterium]